MKLWPWAVIDRRLGDSMMGALMKALLRVYIDRWKISTAALEVLSIEQTLWCPLYNLDTNRRSRNFVLSGKLDKVVRDADNRIVLYDHKTTSSKIAPSSNYWRQLQVEGQPRQYELLLRANGFDVDRVVWDVVRKPSIRPKRLSRAAAKDILATSQYFAQDVSPYALSVLAEAKDGEQMIEDNELFGLRVYDTVFQNSDEYFARQTVTSFNDDLYSHNQNMWDLSKDIVSARKRSGGRHTYNAGACLQFGTPCRYLGICEGSESPDSGNWHKGEVHPELDVEEIECGEKEILTNSRLKAFQTCQRKHHFRYELGLEKYDSASSDALYFGTVWHEVMDSWWAGGSGFQTEGGESNGNRDEVA